MDPDDELSIDDIVWAQPAAESWSLYFSGRSAEAEWRLGVIRDYDEADEVYAIRFQDDKSDTDVTHYVPRDRTSAQGADVAESHGRG